MDSIDITNLLPLGGASVLLIYLLRIIQVERQRWVDERATLLAEHRVEADQRDAEMRSMVAHWQERYTLLRADYDELRIEVAQLREAVRRKEGSP